MSNIITQYSRISHHTLSTTGATAFSVPLNEDFTDGTWTTTDLALSEFGVLEGHDELYVRIGDTIHQVNLGSGATGGGVGTLTQVLASGNTTGGNHIIMTNADEIRNADNTARIGLATGGDLNITGDNDLSIVFDEQVSLESAHAGVSINTAGTSILLGNNLNIDAAGAGYVSNQGLRFFVGTVDTTDATVTTVDTVYLQTENQIYGVTADVVGVDGTGDNAIYVRLTAAFREDENEACFQVGTTTVLNTFSDFTTATATIDLSSNQVRIRCTGEAATDISWRVTTRVMEHNVPI
tara:strand:- start:5091 stop:5975 length:885 start_codon:yes stop_codon:yes gene_type:complete